MRRPLSLATRNTGAECVVGAADGESAPSRFHPTPAGDAGPQRARNASFFLHILLLLPPSSLLSHTSRETGGECAAEVVKIAACCLSPSSSSIQSWFGFVLYVVMQIDSLRIPQVLCDT